MIRRRLRDGARALDPDWLAIISRARIEACAPKFRFRCPGQWENLQATDFVRVRFCAECRKSIHFCDSLADANNFRIHGEAVVVGPGVSRRSGDLYPHRLLMRRLTPDPSLRDVLEELETDRAAD